MNNFIEEYSNSITSAECQYVIEWFEKNTSLQLPGCVDDKVVNKDIKDSMDLPMNLNDDSIINTIISNAILESLKLYKEKYNFLDNLSTWGIQPNYNIQRYLPNQGYHYLHCEHGPKHLSHRMLVWTLYLNTVTDDGGTWYEYQNQVVSSEEGKLCIFPAAWTHMHKGVVSKTQTKYIATGWFDYA